MNILQKYHVVKINGVSAGKKAVTFALVMLACLLLHALIMLFLTDKPLESYLMILKGAFASRFQISETLNRMLPLAMMGLALSVCLKANSLFFGGNACVLAGGIGAAIVGLNCEQFPPALAVLLSMILAMVFGILVASITAILRAFMGINEIYVSVMMNYVLVHTTSFLVERVWPSWEGLDFSNQIFANTKWTTFIKGMNLHWGFVLLILLFAAILYLERTPFGFRIKTFGQNSAASLFRYKESGNKGVIIFAILLVGLVGGLVGATSLCAGQYRFSNSINDNYGFTGIVVARLGGLNPVGILIAAFLLGTLRNGAITMQIATGVPVSIITLLEGLLLIGALCADMLSNYKIVKVEEVAAQ